MFLIWIFGALWMLCIYSRGQRCTNRAIWERAKYSRCLDIQLGNEIANRLVFQEFAVHGDVALVKSVFSDSIFCKLWRWLQEPLKHSIDDLSSNSRFLRLFNCHCNCKQIFEVSYLGSGWRASSNCDVGILLSGLFYKLCWSPHFLCQQPVISEMTV